MARLGASAVCIMFICGLDKDCLSLPCEGGSVASSVALLGSSHEAMPSVIRLSGVMSEALLAVL